MTFSLLRLDLSGGGEDGGGVGHAVGVSSIGVGIGIGAIGVGGGVGKVGVGSIGGHGIVDRQSGNSVNWSRSLLGSKTSGSSIIKGSLELSLGSRHVLGVSKVELGNGLGLDIVVDRGQLNVFSSLNHVEG